MKKERQKALLAVISRYDITTQEELTRRLSQAGFDTTQATISRDMKELGIDKVNSVYAHVGVSPDYNTKYSKLLAECVVSVEAAVNLVVVKTYPGMGDAAGAAIDALGFDGLVGSIAGDDTVLLVSKTAESADQLVKNLSAYHHNTPRV